MKIFEILFNVSYLLIIWFAVFKLYKGSHTKINKFYFYAFLLLAIGDTFHVGLRTISHLLGDINYAVSGIRLIGVGAFLTAITVTLTYLFFTLALNESYKSKGVLKWISLLSVIRLVIVLLPQNQWFTTSPYMWSLLRNIPLILIGYLIIMAMYKTSNPFYKKFANLILWSYIFYLPVILFVKIIPMLGMLMMPKTVVYLLMLKLVYDHHFKMSTSDL